MAEPVLALDGVEIAYGLSQVLFGVSLIIAPRTIMTLLGRNGMGKTTTVRSIMGLTYTPAGSFRFVSEEIRGLPAYRIAQTSVGLVPEGRQIFPDLPVRENLMATAVARRRRLDIRDGMRVVFGVQPGARETWATSSTAASSRFWRSTARR